MLIRTICYKRFIRQPCNPTRSTDADAVITEKINSNPYRLTRKIVALYITLILNSSKNRLYVATNVVLHSTLTLTV